MPLDMRYAAVHPLTLHFVRASGAFVGHAVIGMEWWWLTATAVDEQREAVLAWLCGL